MSDRIIKLLGAQDEHEGLRIVEETNQFMRDMKAVTGLDSYAGILTLVESSVALNREIKTITEKDSSPEQLGTILAYKASHLELPKVQEQIGELAEAGRRRDVASLVKMALSTEKPSDLNPHAGKLVPATAKFWEAESAEKLEAFLKVAPRVIPSEAKQGLANTSSAAATTTTPAGRMADANGRTYEMIPPAEQTALKRTDSDLFNALRNDWVTAGKPVNTSLSHN